MTNKAVKLRSIFYSGTLLAVSLYGMTSLSDSCAWLPLTIFLKFAVVGLFGLIFLEYVNELNDYENQLLSAFGKFSEVYEADVENNVLNSFGLVFDLDNTPNNLVVNENICTKINGKIYSLSDIDVYGKNEEHFSSLLLTVPLEISLKQLLAAAKQKDMSFVNTKNFTYSHTKNNFVIFNPNDEDPQEFPDDIIKIISDLQADLEAEAIFCLTQNNLLQIAIKTKKSYKNSADALYATMCNLSLRAAAKGETHEHANVSEKVRQIKKY